MIEEKNKPCKCGKGLAKRVILQDFNDSGKEFDLKIQFKCCNTTVVYRGRQYLCVEDTTDYASGGVEMKVLKGEPGTIIDYHFGKEGEEK